MSSASRSRMTCRRGRIQGRPYAPRRGLATAPRTPRCDGSEGVTALPSGAVSEALTLHFADPDTRLAGVRLVAPRGLVAPALAFAREDGGWSLTVPDPGVERLEYELELERAD